jgi:isopenicillin-N N-acyltransferase-like protein
MEGLGENKLLKKIVTGAVLTLLLISIATSPCNIQTVKAESRNIVATYGKGYLEDVDGLPVLHVKGSPYEMGYQYGYLLREKVKEFIQYVVDSVPDYEQCANCARLVEQNIPYEYIQEMQGLADGANMDYIDVLICQAIPEVAGAAAGCSGFAVFGNGTADGHLYHGRNHDWGDPPEIIPVVTGLVVVYEPENGNPYVSVGAFGAIYVCSGMNDRGITVGMKGSESTDAAFLDGMPFWLMLKQVLQYSNNLTEAIDIICQTPRTSGWNILLGDSRNLNAAAVEVSANYCKVFWAGDPAEDIGPHYSIPNAVRRTNHYVDPELAATQRSPYDPREWWYSILTNSWDRYEKLSELIEDNYGNISAEMSIEFLRTPPVAWDPINLQSILFDSTDLELWVASANSTTPAYLREFIYLSYDDLFSPYTPDVPDAPEGCFIATATYGTPMAQEIQILREFRDEYLLTNTLGQAFVDFYYKLSPPLAEFITEHPSLKPIVRAGLLPAVAMSTVAVNTGPAEKIAIVSLLALVSVALAVWATRRRGKGPECT